MHLWISWLRSRGKLILTGFLWTLVYMVTCWLFGLPLPVSLYAFALCVFLGLILLGTDYWRYRKRYQEISRILGGFLQDPLFYEELPEPKDCIEEAYQKLLRQTGERMHDLEEDGVHRYADLADYYMAWAHQVKTPIASMRLKLGSQDSALCRDLEMDLIRIEQYVEMVMCYLRLDSESTDYLLKEYDLDGIVRQAVKQFAPQFIGKKLQLVYEPLSCTVLTDEKWLLFVIGQVLSNALKYTREGSITISLEEPKILCIRDTGIGIAPEDVPRVFEKGFTGFNGREDKKASGLGLYLCKRICGNLGHSIRLESVPGEGTAVRIGLAKKALEVE